LLEKLDIPVVVSRGDSNEKARRGLLILAEPSVADAAARDHLAALVRGAPRVLVVLPKWGGAARRDRRWLADARQVPAEEVGHVLVALGISGSVVRRPVPPAALPTGTDGSALHVVGDVQLLGGDADDGEQLVRRIDRDGDASTVHVLADPDVLNNVGLRSSDNARFAVQLIDQLRDRGPVVFDETIHGYVGQRSLVPALFRFPLVFATLQVMICAVIVVWAAMGRFGPARAAPPPINPGKDFLIRNTAALLRYGGHHGHALERYLQLTVAAVRHQLNAPSLAPEAMTAWLERVRQARGGRISLIELEHAADTADTPVRVIEVAAQVFRWRMEMTHGTDRRS
jgi:hypothetical protein